MRSLIFYLCHAEAGFDSGHDTALNQSCWVESERFECVVISCHLIARVLVNDKTGGAACCAGKLPGLNSQGCGVVAQFCSAVGFQQLMSWTCFGPIFTQICDVSLLLLDAFTTYLFFPALLKKKKNLQRSFFLQLSPRHYKHFEFTPVCTICNRALWMQNLLKHQCCRWDTAGLGFQLNHHCFTQYHSFLHLILKWMFNVWGKQNVMSSLCL